ncbi:LytTR family transcriptional regulator [Actibacterium mucosum KCTC 23349]|uniref:LytTR family transcriptional regulator n=1 Tax=Actibacterium mucosum KCTC 23349 TaxID=1454373 RepID=A0A037ZGJ0_9RHOB|nr:DUF4159 domain-containing protein [Actibacterium mucosum]KAJ54656.1 LytTR family transcriptional regulator [Actibacterium mucosum KCTC 23349]
MWIIGPIGFTTPLILLALAVLPVLWLLLRAVPPAPIRKRFPGVVLLLGLRDDDNTSDRTPWWLLLLRLLAVAAAIVGFAGPVLNPKPPVDGRGPLLVLIDGGWADARDWAGRMARVDAILEDAARKGRATAVALATDLPADGAPFQSAAEWQTRLPSVQPNPWRPDLIALAEWVEAQEGAFDTFWVADGLFHEGRNAVVQALSDRGELTVFQSATPVFALRGAAFSSGAIEVPVLRNSVENADEVSVVATGLDPSGARRDLARVTAVFESGDAMATARFELPPELRNRISRFSLPIQRSAGSVALTDDSLKRREVALLSGRDEREGLQLLAPLHYLRQALEVSADLIDGDLLDVLLANPDVVVLADVAQMAGGEQAALLDWVDRGGLLVRFAGPRLAASDISRATEDALMPVRLRSGGRTVGGAMSWGAPKTLQAFPEGSPFFGLPVPDEVTVTAQVLAQPGPNLAERTIATLQDGTPLVTRKKIGQGQVILFHVTANAEWSSLPLSGLYVQMLERLAVSTRPPQPTAEDLAGAVFQPQLVLDAFGEAGDAATLAGVAGETLAGAQPGPLSPPGLYASGERRIALNTLGPEDTIETATWPAGTVVEGLAVASETSLKGPALALAALLLMIDILASLLLTGRLRNAMAVVAVLAVTPIETHAQTSDDLAIINAASEVVLAYVLTGDAQVDRVSQAGLLGLSQKLFQRTSVEPVEPVGLDLETADLSLYPFLYWPVTLSQNVPSAEAYARLNRYLRSGGMIMFDTRDADIARFSGNSPEGRHLQELARPLDIPPLEPIPEDHVLTRAFYLLQDFPGRHNSRDVWVEAAPPDAEKVEGMPFRNLNDGVTPVVLGGNDWATAWAVDENGFQMFPVGRGYTGERQREVAYRFGINLIMHVLTGNYKSDQVHVPALLDRLGQ